MAGGSSNMKDYLRKYMSDPPPSAQGGSSSTSSGLKKRRKKKPPATTVGASTRIIDEDAEWAVATKESDDEDAPVVVNAEEDEEELRRLEETKAFHSNAWETIREGEATAAQARRSPSPSPPPHPGRSPGRSSSTRRRGRGSPEPSTSPPPAGKRARRRSPTPSPEPSPAATGRDDDGGTRLSDGRSAGLQTGAAVRADADRRVREQQAHFASLSAAQTGRDAPTVYRDKLGKKVDIAAQKAELLEQRRKREAEEERNMKWGTGVVQHERELALAKKLASEKSAPLATYVDDRERNEELAERTRWGDPMAFMVNKAKAKKEVRPKYNGPPPPPNRFAILPGYRWDGVDRSNGFEGKLFLERNRGEAFKMEAYKWSTEDM